MAMGTSTSTSWTISPAASQRVIGMMASRGWNVHMASSRPIRAIRLAHTSMANTVRLVRRPSRLLYRAARASIPDGSSGNAQRPGSPRCGMGDPASVTFTTGSCTSIPTERQIRFIFQKDATTSVRRKQQAHVMAPTCLRSMKKRAGAQPSASYTGDVTVAWSRATALAPVYAYRYQTSTTITTRMAPSMSRGQVDAHMMCDLSAARFMVTVEKTTSAAATPYATTRAGLLQTFPAACECAALPRRRCSPRYRPESHRRASATPCCGQRAGWTSRAKLVQRAPVAAARQHSPPMVSSTQTALPAPGRCCRQACFPAAPMEGRTPRGGHLAHGCHSPRPPQPAGVRGSCCASHQRAWPGMEAWGWAASSSSQSGRPMKDVQPPPGNWDPLWIAASCGSAAAFPGVGPLCWTRRGGVS
eukprot:355910-Chlamydomonas_euryale.AAC.6